MQKPLLFFLFLFSIITAQTSNRYTDSSFILEQVLTDEVYAMAPELNEPYTVESSTHFEDLKISLICSKRWYSVKETTANYSTWRRISYRQ